MKVRKRAESSTPAMPMTRFLGNFDTMYATCAMASSGLVTTMMMQLGETATACSVAALDDFVVRQQKIVAAHARLAREPGGDDHDVGIRRGTVIVRAGDGDVVAFHRPGLHQVEAFALRNAFGDVHEDDIAQFLFRRPNGTVGADVTGANDCKLISQSTNPFRLEVKNEGEEISISSGWLARWSCCVASDYRRRGPRHPQRLSSVRLVEPCLAGSLASPPASVEPGFE